MTRSVGSQVQFWHRDGSDGGGWSHAAVITSFCFGSDGWLLLHKQPPAFFARRDGRDVSVRERVLNLEQYSVGGVIGDAALTGKPPDSPDATAGCFASQVFAVSGSQQSSQVVPANRAVGLTPGKRTSC